jgi:hypothetical protein
MSVCGWTTNPSPARPAGMTPIGREPNRLCQNPPAARGLSSAFRRAGRGAHVTVRVRSAPAGRSHPDATPAHARPDRVSTRRDNGRPASPAPGDSRPRPRHRYVGLSRLETATRWRLTSVSSRRARAPTTGGCLARLACRSPQVGKASVPVPGFREIYSSPAASVAVVARRGRSASRWR